MDDRIVLKCKSKANLFLEIKKRREDGLHELESLFYPLESPCDYMYIYPGENESGMRVTCSMPALEKDNILHATYKTFVEKTGLSPGIYLHLQKNIPIGAGLGGGSSNAASLLKYLWESSEDYLQALDLDINEIALSLGSDVPFFLYNSPAWVSGVGEKIEPLGIDLGGLYLLVICPDIFISTAHAYQAWDDSKYRRKCLSETQSLLTREGNSNIKNKFATHTWLFNSFEQVVFPEYSSLELIKGELLQLGASGVVLSGSGAAMTALFKEWDKVEKASSWLSKRGIRAYVNSL